MVNADWLDYIKKHASKSGEELCSEVPRKFEAKLAKSTLIEGNRDLVGWFVAGQSL